MPVTGAAEPVVPRVAAHLEPPPSPPSPLPLQPSPDSGVQVAVVPVANAACIELDDLREQQARCQPSSGTLPTKATTAAAAAAAALPVPCPASLERECVRHRARPAALCAEARATTRPPLVVGWRQFVFAAATFEDEATAALLQAAADSWLQLARGAELLLATDADDGRSDAQIAPDTRGAVAVRIHRCSTCRGRRCARPPCDGRREGWLARTKLLSLDAKDMRPSVPASAGRLHTLGQCPPNPASPPAQPPAQPPARPPAQPPARPPAPAACPAACPAGCPGRLPSRLLAASQTDAGSFPSWRRSRSGTARRPAAASSSSSTRTPSWSPPRSAGWRESCTPSSTSG